MFRKLTLALGATIAIGFAALIPTSASAHMHGGHGLGHWHGRLWLGRRHRSADPRRRLGLLRYKETL